MLFHLPSFHQRYWVDGQRHIADCRNGRPADCFVCQMCKVADGIYSGRYAVVPSEEDLEEARREREAREAEKERARQGTAMDVDKPHNHTSLKRRKQVRTARGHLHTFQPCAPPARQLNQLQTAYHTIHRVLLGVWWLRCSAAGWHTTSYVQATCGKGTRRVQQQQAAGRHSLDYRHNRSPLPSRPWLVHAFSCLVCLIGSLMSGCCVRVVLYRMRSNSGIIS